MLKPKPPPATYADLEALPANMVGEVLFGVLHAHPRPVPRHGVAAIDHGTELSGPFRRGRGGPGGWIFVVEPELHLGPHVVAPDVAGRQVERLTQFPDTTCIETPPDWLAEVPSPSTSRIDRTDKLAIDAEFGVDRCWYVAPVARTLEVLALAGSKWQIAATLKNDDRVSAPPFEVHTFALDVL